MAYIEPLKEKIYYSQNREDLILRAFFPDIKSGFYVDVGAFDPDYDSVTKYFSLKGWTGINIEPQPDKFLLFRKKRKNDINLNIGISDSNSKLVLRSYKNQGLSTFSDEVKDEYNKSPTKEVSRFKDIKVDVRTLEGIFSEYKIGSIQFLKVDVEGLEYEVLRGNNWTVYRPQVICIEFNHPKNGKDWKRLLIEKGYESIFNDGLNLYFVDSKSDRKQYFNYIKYVIIERGGGLGFSDYKIILEQQKKIKNLDKIIASADLELKKKQLEIEKTKKLLINQESTREVGKKFRQLIVRKIKKVNKIV